MELISYIDFPQRCLQVPVQTWHACDSVEEKLNRHEWSLELPRNGGHDCYLVGYLDHHQDFESYRVLSDPKSRGLWFKGP